MRIRVWMKVILSATAVTMLGLQPLLAAETKRTTTTVPTAATKIQSVEGMNEYRLANGLRILMYPDQSKATITVNITYLVGSRQENYGETGMAHLLEHMMFKGTPGHPNIGKDFNARGMRFNGTTSLDRTNYFELFQANDEHLDWALQMEADRMVNSFIARKDLDTEMTVVRNEYERGENSPVSVLIKRMQSVAFDWHNYGNSTIGNRSDIENVEIPNLQAFYHLYYQPDNAVLLVAGKFDEAKTLQLISKYFGAIPKPTRILPKLWTVEPIQDGERMFYVRRTGDIQVVALGYKISSGLAADADALGFVNSILTDTPSGRLHKALVETGMAAQVGGYPLVGVDQGLHMIFAIVKKGDPIEPVQAAMIKVVEEFYKNPPTDEEMARTRLAIANSTERTLNDAESIGVDLSENIALGNWELFLLSRNNAETLTKEQVQAAATKYYKRDNRTVGIFAPEDKPLRAEIAPALSLNELLKDFKPKQAAAMAEAFDPSPENIEKRTQLVTIGGIRAALLPKKTRGEVVSFDLRLDRGDLQSLKGQQMLLTMGEAMPMLGTTKYTREQLEDEMSKLKMEGNVNARGASFQTTRSNLPAAIRLAAHMLREPSFVESEFEQSRKKLLTGLEFQQTDPNGVAGDALNGHFNIYSKDDIRYSPSLRERIEAIKSIKLADVKRAYQQFSGASHGRMSIVGDFDVAEVTKAVTQAFDGWQNKSPFTAVTRDYKDIAPIKLALETPDKENAFFVAKMNLDINKNDADYPALVIANYILGGDAGFDSRLMARIRVKEGLSYGVGSSLAAGDRDRAGGWVAYAISAPQNSAKVEAAFQDELAKALRDGFTDAEVKAAISGALQIRTQQFSQDGQLASEWVASLDVDQTFVWQQQFFAHIKALTPNDVNSALRKYIDPAKLTIVKAGDFARVK
jgi:zinc protease